MASEAKMSTSSLCVSLWCFQRLALYGLAVCTCPGACPLLGCRDSQLCGSTPVNLSQWHLWICHSDPCGVMFPENFRPCWLWELQADLDAALGVALDFILKWESIFCHSLHCLAPMGSMNIQCLGARETQKSTSRLEAISQAKRNILCIQRSWIELGLMVRETNTWN